MKKQTVFITGATGGMGFESLKQILGDKEKQNIIGKAMAGIVDAIMFHNCLDNVLEYVSDRDSGRLMRNLCLYTADGTLPEEFWGHIYNIGGGESCRVSTYEMYQRSCG